MSHGRRETLYVDTACAVCFYVKSFSGSFFASSANLCLFEWCITASHCLVLSTFCPC